MPKVSWQGPSEWKEWVEWLSSGLHGRNRWRLSVLLFGILFATGRRTVTTWLRAAVTVVSIDRATFGVTINCAVRLFAYVRPMRLRTSVSTTPNAAS